MRYAWTAKPGNATGEIVFAPADNFKTLSVPIADDKTPEDDQTFTVELKPVGSEPPARGAATVTVVDDDSIVVRKSGRVLVGPDGTVVDVRRCEAEFRGSRFSGAVFRERSASHAGGQLCTACVHK